MKYQSWMYSPLERKTVAQRLMRFAFSGVGPEKGVEKVKVSFEICEITVKLFMQGVVDESEEKSISGMKSSELPAGRAHQAGGESPKRNDAGSLRVAVELRRIKLALLSVCEC
ncbi:hypothetical protein RB195_014389 [Necator americanus]|uniref:Uncharacterized protein n=1 Tax=Necator americanus TaxID=51031 RepID=A0ABR1E133_NECAM